MSYVDWILVVVPLAFVFGVAVYTRRFVKSVADFLSGGRCAGRYLLANARGESDAGLANTMSKFEQILIAGFVLNFWEKLQYPVLLLVGISGFIIYRFRETRALTLAQFLEMRYSRHYRLFMGVLAFISGILNYGIFPAVSARFFIYFLKLPHTVDLGLFTISTFALIMISYLILTLFMIIIGGQVTLMVTDCIEGIISHLIYIAIVISVLYLVRWDQIVTVMSSPPPGYSMINPFDAHEVEDFNLWFILMYLFIQVYTKLALQNKQGFNSAAKTPHDSRMGDVLGYWRTYARLLMILVLAVCAVTYLRHPDFSGEAVSINAEIQSIDDSYLQKQMTVPITLSHLLPVGIKGLFCAMMIMGLLAGDSGHIHSWGTIFVQDVVLPLRKRPLSTRQHIWVLRLAMCGVALFAFFFSLVWPQNWYIALWWSITMIIFTGGAGAAIIGGLYWKKGTTAAAWSATITGSVLAFSGILLSSKLWPTIAVKAQPFVDRFGVQLPERFWLNPMEASFLSACIAATIYFVVSLLTCRQDFNLDRMLHRGKYAIEDEPLKLPLPLRKRFSLGRILGFDTEFTFRDKLAAGGIFWWSMLLVAINVGVTIWNLWIREWPIEWWSIYWLLAGIAFPMLIGVATLIWFGYGGMVDIRNFFRDLRVRKRDATDDGRVVKSDETSEEPVPENEAAPVK